MKQKLITIAVLLFVCFNFSFAVEKDCTLKDTDQNVKIENTQQILQDENLFSENLIENENKSKHDKRFIKKSNRLLKRLEKYKNTSPQRILVLMIIGFPLLLTGAILAALGVALIPAIVLAVVGGALFIVGVLAG